MVPLDITLLRRVDRLLVGECGGILIDGDVVIEGIRIELSILVVS